MKKKHYLERNEARKKHESRWIKMKQERNMNQDESRWIKTNQDESRWIKMNQDESRWIKMNQGSEINFPETISEKRKKVYAKMICLKIGN